MANPLAGKAKPKGAGFEVPPPGAYPAIVVGLVDLGTHEETYEGKAYESRKLLVCFELGGNSAAPAPRTKEGKPFVLARQYSVSFAETCKLRQVMESLRGKNYSVDDDIDYSKLMGVKLQVTLKGGKSQRGNDYVTLDGVSPLVRGTVVDKSVHTPFGWYMDDEAKTPPDLAQIPAWVPWSFGEDPRDVIKRSSDYLRLTGQSAPLPGDGAGTNGHAVGGDDPQSDEIPF